MRIAISVCGEGFGHSSRMIALYLGLKKQGHDVFLLSYGDAYKRIKKFSKNVFKTYPEVKMCGEDGSFHITKSIIKSMGYVNPIKTINFEKRFFKHKKIDIVISDSRFLTILAAFLLKIPIILVTNQTGVTLYNYPKIKNQELDEFIEKIGEKIKTEFAFSLITSIPIFLQYYLSDVIIVPDYKKPNTICKDLLSKKREIKLKTEIVGPLILKNNKKSKEFDYFNKKRKKVCVLLGGQKYRRGLYKKLTSKIKKIKTCNFVSASIFQKKCEKGDNYLFLKTVKNASNLIKNSDLVITSAGHSTIMECLNYGIPMILIPDDNQPEQKANAKRAEKLGFAKIIKNNGLNKLDKIIASFPDKKTKEKLKKMKKLKENGIKRSIQIIENVYYRYKQY